MTATITHYSKKSKESPEVNHRERRTEKSRADSTEKLRKKRKKAEKVAKERLGRGTAKEGVAVYYLEASTSSSGTSNESKRMILPEKLPSVTPPSPLQVLKKEAYDRYKESRAKVEAFAERYFNNKGMTEREIKEMQVARSQLKTCVAQIGFDMNEQTGSKINLFCPEVKREFSGIDYEKLNQILNDKLLLIPGHIKINLHKMFGLVRKPKETQKDITQSWLRISTPGVPPRPVPYTTLQEQFSLADSYKAAVIELCRKIKDPGHIIDNETYHGNNIEKILRELNVVLEGKSDLFREKLVEAIEVRYLEEYLEPLLLQKAKDIIVNYQKKDANAYFMYDEMVPNLKKKFETEVKKDPLPDWERAIWSGIVFFVDAFHEVLWGPLDDPGEHKPAEREIALNAYVLGCQKVVGEHLFNDADLMVELCRLIQEEASIHSPGNPGETLLDQQKRIMTYLGSIQEDMRALMSFFSNVTEKLNSWNDDRGSERNADIGKYPVGVMLQYLMMFYRAPSQTFMWGPTGVLRDTYKLIFQADDIFGKLENWNDNETKQIYIQFNEHDLSLKFVRKGIIGCKDKTDSYYIFTQDLTVKIPKPGGADLKDAVSVQFYYERPKDTPIPADDLQELEYIREKLSFVMRVLGFPAIKQIKSK